MEVVICYCLNCNQELGRYRNSWNGIGKNFYSPVYPMLTFTHGYEVFGEVYPGPVDTALEHSFLQNLKCKKCESVLGTRCDSAPDGHMLAQDQQILKRQSMSVVSESTGMTAGLVVTKSVMVLPDDMNKKSSSSRRAATAQPTVRRKINDNQSYDENLPQSSNKRPLPVKDADISDFADFRSWAQDAIDVQKSDIKRISSTLSNMEGEMQVFRSFFREVRAELQQSQKMREDYYQGRRKISKLVQDLAELEKKVKEAGNVEEKRGMSGESLSRDIEIIVSDMQQISDKANEVEDVKSGLLHISKQFRGLEKIATSFVTPSQADPGASDIGDFKRQLEELQNRLDLVQRTVQRASTTTEKAADSSHTAPEIAQSVAPVTVEAVEFDRSTTENAQKTRLIPRVEIRVPVTRRSANQSGRPRSSLEISRGETLNSDLGEGIFKENPAPLKRKYDLVENPTVTADEENDSELPLPRKRGRPSLRARVDVQHADTNLGVHSLAPPVSKKDQLIEVFSSERGSTPDTPARDEVPQNSTKTTKVPTKQPAPIVPSKAKADANVIIPEPGARRVSLRKVSSTSNLASSTTVVNQETPRPRRLSYSYSEKVRDENGLILTASGRVDRRSLRPKIQSKETPQSAQGQREREFGFHSHSATKSAENTALKSSTKGPSTSSDAVIPSIELEEQEHSHRVTRSSEHSVLHPLLPTPKIAQSRNSASTPTLTSSQARPTFKCDVCSTIFAFLGGLNFHKRKSNCYKNGVENYEGVRKAELEARDKIVRETLEREMAQL